MDTAAPSRFSLFGLIRALTGDTRTFIRQEIELAKTEISEKLATLGRNAAALAIGGFVAYAGLIVFLIGLGWLLAWAFQLAGLQPLFAAFVGLGAMGLVVIAVGCVLLLKGLKTLSSQSLAPQRTIYTLQELKGSAPAQGPTQESQPASKPSSAEMQSRVEATENRMGETIDELGRRLSPQYMKAKVQDSIEANPYRSGLIALGAGVLSGLFLRSRFRRAA